MVHAPAFLSLSSDRPIPPRIPARCRIPLLLYLANSPRLHIVDEAAHGHVFQQLR